MWRRLPATEAGSDCARLPIFVTIPLSASRERGERYKIILECLISFLFALLDLNENKSTLRRQTEEPQQDNGHLLVSIHSF